MSKKKKVKIEASPIFFEFTDRRDSIPAVPLSSAQINLRGATDTVVVPAWFTLHVHYIRFTYVRASGDVVYLEISNARRIALPAWFKRPDLYAPIVIESLNTFKFVDLKGGVLVGGVAYSREVI